MLTLLVCQVPGSALDSQLMEGSSCLEPVEQSIILSLWTVSPRNCVIEQNSEWEPVDNSSR